MNVAEASLEEARYYLRLSFDLGYLPAKNSLSEEALEVGRLLGSYTRSILSSSS
jgi:four helix bundle protein